MGNRPLYHFFPLKVHNPTSLFYGPKPGRTSRMPSTSVTYTYETASPPLPVRHSRNFCIDGRAIFCLFHIFDLCILSNNGLPPTFYLKYMQATAVCFKLIPKFSNTYSAKHIDIFSLNILNNGSSG